MMEQEQMNREYKVGDLLHHPGWGKCIVSPMRRLLLFHPIILM